MNHPFSYYLGINSLEEIASKESKVCVMNILGNESRGVTPTSHAYSGGNIVVGIQYGRNGGMETPIGEIPVYSRLADAVKHHQFDTGVVYLPPEAVFHSVTELCHYNSGSLKKIILLTEKISVKDQRLIRAVSQANKIDVFGANCLGVADSWNHVRIGGALGGDRPEETLVKGSIALHSNSGNFSTTISEYLKTSGFGTSTVVSSGKDVIIQYAVPEFLFAAQNDPRTKAVVLYVEPGGYYERIALDMINNNQLNFTKPMIVCITGRWKSNLTRACGHAGALAGSGDDAIAKEKWFDDYFGVSGYDPNNPTNVSEKGVRVSSIQHIPEAMSAVFQKLNLEVDFEPKGNLRLKPWFANDFGLKIPPQLKILVVEATEPYKSEINEINKQVGATFLRQTMRNASGASRLNPISQVAELHGIPILELTDYPFENNMLFAITKSHADKEQLRLFNIVLNHLAKVDDFYFEIVKIAKRNYATPNEVLISVVSVFGELDEFKEMLNIIKTLLEAFTEYGIRDIYSNVDFDKLDKIVIHKFKMNNSDNNNIVNLLISEIENCYKASNILKWIVRFLKMNRVVESEKLMIASILIHFAYPSLALKKISRDSVENMFTFISIQAKLTILATIDIENNDYIQNLRKVDNYENLTKSFTEVAYNAVFNSTPSETDLVEFSALLALTLTNGPGTISAKGAKESVSARNNISTAYAGFLANTGLSHGGSGYEAVDYLLEQFEEVDISNPEQAGSTIDVQALALKSAQKYFEFKNEQKIKGEQTYKRIPCINHPVFKGKKKNIDPREEYIYKKLASQNIGNVFWDFYHELVESLYKIGASKNIYCVNIDAVIAVISLKLMWKDYTLKKLSRVQMMDIGFVIFLLGRMVGVSAEIADHRDRGTDMDCRTPQSELKFIS